ncbi:hypothetical protein L3Q82_001303 [Scortum barcoo]|uniref:Uncharacterized protein n=1 Tax=Scortum barcoo TaxID=214431 RepID=A0ACB8W7H8_9TELE|nr:hypothetical protein L3Q82_001303 [Scortum barcoo]
MFPTTEDMDVFTAAGGRDRLSFARLPYTIEEEEGDEEDVTFSEGEDVSAEKDCLSTSEALLCCRTEKRLVKKGGREGNVRAGGRVFLLVGGICGSCLDKR